MTQLGLDFTSASGTAKSFPRQGRGTSSPCQPEALSVDQRAQKFHEANPTVFNELRELALADVDRGARYISIARLFETLRIRRSLDTKGDGFKLNNSYRAWFSRALMAAEPRLVGVFRTRER